MSALKTQVGGGHYCKLKIQPVEYIHANGLGFIEGAVVKYITRWRDKDGIKDLEKIKHFVDLLIELETKPLVKPEPAPEVSVIVGYGLRRYQGIATWSSETSSYEMQREEPFR